MKNNQKLLTGLIIFAIIINFLITIILLHNLFREENEEYEELKIGLTSNNIDYCVIYENDSLLKYKVFKLNLFGKKEDLRNEFVNSEYWENNKFYEYEMNRFYEKNNGEVIKIDREDLYYHDNNGVYAIIDLKNAKLYYLKSKIYGTHRNFTEVLGIETKDRYIEREIYSVREGLQFDGLDYYVYKFSSERNEENIKELNNNEKWRRDKLEDEILERFTYNKSEILRIKNGYYYYELVCRTSDKNKKLNFTEDEATGCEIGVYDIDNNILYYYWESI